MTAPVGSFAANGFGLYDLHGNVGEWVEDCWHDSYQGAPNGGEAWVTDCGDDRRALRNGSWFLISEWVRSAFRFRETTELRSHFSGFRVARTL